MYRLSCYSFIILCCLFLSCGDSNLGAQPKDIETAKQQWQSFGYSDYQIDVERSCFCPLPSRYTAIIKDNAVVQVIDAKSGKTIEQTAGYSTIGELFSWLEQVAPKDPQKLELDFHPTYGYPTYINYNQSDQIADEELLMKISNLKSE